jgi:hypothetical protein
MALGPTQPLIEWVPKALSLRVKQPGHKADHSPPSSVEVKECVELYLHSLNTPSWRGAHLKNTGTTLPLLFTLPRRRFEDNIRMDLRETGWEVVEWSDLA